jgi:flagellar protein FlaG
MSIENLQASLASPVAVAPVAPISKSTAMAEPEPVQVQAPPEAEPVAIQKADAAASAQRLAVAEKLMGADKSLVIEKDPESQGFIYKTINRNTGEVVRVWPREEVASKLSAMVDTDARSVMQGMMIDAKA